MASESISTDSEGSVFQVLEGVVYYVDPTTSSNTMNAFVGRSKEQVRIFLSGKHCSLKSLYKTRIILLSNKQRLFMLFQE